MEGARDTGVWVLADGVSIERGDVGATDVGSTRPMCNSDVRARGVGGVAMFDGPRGIICSTKILIKLVVQSSKSYFS